MAKIATASNITTKSVCRFYWKVARDFKKNRLLYLMVLPVVAYYIIFHYIPMYGIQIAFRDYSIGQGFTGSPWVGLKHFIDFFESFYFTRVVKNTLAISLLELVFGFPAPILFALLLNEVRWKNYKKTIQTISYLPYFISMVVICGIVIDFSSTEGLINQFLSIFGVEKSPLLQAPQNFRPIYIGSGIWQYLGWNSIIYIAALAGIDPELYQAAIMDGAGRFKQIWHITLPGIRATIVILLILNIGSLLNVGFEKIILLYNPAIYDVADVISSYVYRKGLQQLNWSYGAAVGFFNSVVNFLLLILANKISRKVNDVSLW